MKINFNKPVLALDGKPVQNGANGETTLGQILSQAIASHGKGDALKLFGWAQKMYNAEEIEVDESDLSVLKELINNPELGLTNLSKAQMLRVCNEAEKK